MHGCPLRVFLIVKADLHSHDEPDLHSDVARRWSEYQNYIMALGWIGKTAHNLITLPHDLSHDVLSGSCNASNTVE